MRVADHVQKGSRSRPCYVGNVLDKPPTDTMLPEVRLDEQRIQFRSTVRTRHHSGEAGDGTITLCHEDATIHDLLDRQRDRIWMRQKRITIARIAERCTALERLAHRLLVASRQPDRNISFHFTPRGWHH